MVMWVHVRTVMCITVITYIMLTIVEGGNVDQREKATSTNTRNVGNKPKPEMTESQKTSTKKSSSKKTCTKTHKDPCMDNLHIAKRDDQQSITQGPNKYAIGQADIEVSKHAATEDQKKLFDKPDHKSSAETAFHKINVYNVLSDMKEHLSEIVNKYGVDGPSHLIANMRSSLEDWKGEHLNIGVIGRSGVGKSTFINTIRGLTAEDMGAAETGATETTQEPAAYPHPDNKLLVFWDLPGMGTQHFPSDTCFKDERIQFDRYDMFIIVCNGRFFEDDYLLAKEATRSNRLYLFVRTKVDIDVQSERRAKPKTFRKNPKATDTLLEKIRAEVVYSFIDNNLYTDGSVFLKDCLDMTWTKYDFGKLTERLITGFIGLKREAFVLALNILQPGVLEQKVAVLRNRIWKVSVISAIGAVVPVPGVSYAVDLALILEEAFFYMEQLGISEQQLARAADVAELDINEFKAKLNLKTNDLSWTKYGIAAYMAKHVATSLAKYEAVETFVKIVMPGAGSVIASGISYTSTYACLYGILEMMASDAKQLHTYMLSFEQGI